MRPTLAIAVAALSALIFCPFARAKDFVDSKAGLSVTIPDDWKTEVDEEGGLSAEAPDGVDISMAFQTVKGADSLKDALDDAEKQLDEDFDEFDIDDKVAEGEVNGLKALVVKGTGTDHEEDGTKTTFVWAGVIVANGKHFLICMIYGTPEHLKKHEDIMKGIIESIKKTDKKGGFAETPKKETEGK